MVSHCGAQNTYSLRSPGGFELPNHYNGANLYPAYVEDGHPLTSLWYASKRWLDADRKAQEAAVRATPAIIASVAGTQGAISSRGRLT